MSTYTLLPRVEQRKIEENSNGEREAEEMKKVAATPIIKPIAKQRKEYAPYHQRMLSMMSSDKYNLIHVINMLEAARKKVSNNIFLLLGIANIHFHLEEYDEALSKLDLAQTLVPSHPETYLLKSKALAKQQKHEEAAEVLENGVKLNPEDSVLLSALSKAKAKLNRIKNANVREMQKVWEIQEEETIESIDLSPDCRLAALGLVEGDIRVIDATTGQLVRSLPGHRFGNLMVAFSPSGTLLATSGHDGYANIYNTSTFEKICAIHHKSDNERSKSVWVQKIEWISDDKLITCSGKKMRTWDVQGQLITEYESHPSTISDVTFNSHAQCIATTSYCTVAIFNLENPTPIRTATWTGSLLGLSWTGNAQWLAVSTQDSAVVVWNMKSDGIFPVSDYDGLVKAVFDPSCKLLATTGSDVMKLFDFSGSFGEEGFEDRPESSIMPIAELAHNDLVVDVSFHKSGKMMSTCSKDGVIFLWITKEEIPLCVAKYTESVQTVKWVEKDSKKYLLAVYSDGKIISWTL